MNLEDILNRADVNDLNDDEYGFLHDQLHARLVGMHTAGTLALQQDAAADLFALALVESDFDKQKDRWFAAAKKFFFLTR